MCRSSDDLHTCAVSQVEQIMRQLEGEYRESVLATLASLGQGLPPGVDPLDIALDLTGGDSSNGGSDSSDSDGPPVHMQWRGQCTCPHVVERSVCTIQTYTYVHVHVHVHEKSHI